MNSKRNIYLTRLENYIINNYLYIAINTNTDTLDLTILKEYKEQLNDIKNFVHELNLDNDLFKL